MKADEAVIGRMQHQLDRIESTVLDTAKQMSQLSGELHTRCPAQDTRLTALENVVEVLREKENARSTQENIFKAIMGGLWAMCAWLFAKLFMGIDK